MPPLVAQMDRRHYVFGLSVCLCVPVSVHMYTCVRAETFLLPLTYSFKFLNVSLIFLNHLYVESLKLITLQSTAVMLIIVKNKENILRFIIIIDCFKTALLVVCM